jgi:hypothetical protein
MLRTDCSIPQKRCVMLGGRVVGQIDGTTFIKSVHASTHQLQRPQAWAIDAVIFDEEIKPNCVYILISDQETDNKYRCTVETFDKFKGVLDRGHGQQYYLTLNHWHIEIKGEKQLSLW